MPKANAPTAAEHALETHTADGLWVEVQSAHALRAWLHAHHGQRASVWLVTWKKAHHSRHVARRQVLEALVAYGWVDSLPRTLDTERTMLRISPRKAASNWSKLNRSIAEALIARGQMQPAGQAAVDRAKDNGGWTRLDAVEALTVPADLARALAAEPNARAHFDRFPPSSRRGILEWILQAKRPETRAKRIAETAGKAAENHKANHPKGRDLGPAPNVDESE